jgi:hypothetical protein
VSEQPAVIATKAAITTQRATCLNIFYPLILLTKIISPALPAHAP